jgi:aspartyl protease family protein
MLGLDEDQLMRLLYLVALLAFVIAWRGYRRAGRGRDFLRLGVWVAIALLLVAIYAYRAPLLNFAAPILHELAPARVAEITSSEGERELAILRGPDGHFHADARANGATIRFLVDTGASATVLTMADAKRAGIDTDALSFDLPVETANGTAFSASATLDSLEIGPYRFSSVRVGIMPAAALKTSLLGMSTINRFAGWRIEGDRMVLTP